MAPDVFDYIVVGGGSAGCVAANRLSADRSVRVCLIEAGPSDRSLPTRWKVDTPVANPMLLGDARFNWQHTFAADPRLRHAGHASPRGKLLGGSSAVNGMIYIRGHPSDYDAWEASGNVGWGWKDVLPTFLEHEDYHAEPGPLHAKGGELHVQKSRKLHDASRAFVEAATQLQFRRNEDFNGPTMEGFGSFDVTQYNGERWSSARAFLHPVARRENLTVLTDTHACRLSFDGRRASGLVVRQHATERTLQAQREVILCGGAFASPQLLMLSGIGPGAKLKELGLDVMSDLAGVGLNLQDHASVAVTVSDPSNTAYALTGRRLPHLTAEFFRYVVSRTGTLASNVVEAGGFICTRAGLPAPDIQFVFIAALKDQHRAMPRRHGFMVVPVLLRPASRGYLDIVSPDPAIKPVIHGNFLSHDEDLRALVAGIRVARQIVAAPAFDQFRGNELLPGAAVESSADLADFTRRTVSTIYHPVGTCKMGLASDASAVVDPQLRVHGVDGLRVADCAVMPTIVSGNTNAPAMMIGGKASAFIKRHWQPRPS